MTLRKWFLISSLLYLPTFQALAQFNVDGQYVVRGEYRNGYNRLMPKNTDPASFIAQRARLQASYTTHGFTFNTSLQDIRTWGNTPQVKLTDNNLSVYEAWGEATLSNHWKVKLGRQELNYDNARFLGNLDWALQGRTHDFALVKYEKNSTKLHFGGGFNQDAQQNAGNLFTLANQYKTAQMIWLENTWGKLHLSALVWNDGRQFTTTSSGGVTDKGVRFRQTVGLPTVKYQSGNTSISGFYYHQLGRDLQGSKVNAFDGSAQISHQINIDTARARKIRLTAGFEILSGTSNRGLTIKNKSFSPLYGTNHLHNGYMDLFYVSGAHENNVGLQDYFLRTRFDFNRKFFTQVDAHAFATQADVYWGPNEKLNSYLGTEIDLTFGYLFNDAVSFQGGYSQLFHTKTFEIIQGNINAKNTQNWVYLMLIFRPTLKNKFIGVLL